MREAHRFDPAKLEAYLAERIDGFQTPMEVRQFKGGQSNPTYQLVTPNRKYVLRRKPPVNQDEQIELESHEELLNA